MFVAMVAMLPMIDLSAMSHSKRSKKKLDSPGLRHSTCSKGDGEGCLSSCRPRGEWARGAHALHACMRAGRGAAERAKAPWPSFGVTDKLGKATLRRMHAY